MSDVRESGETAKGVVDVGEYPVGSVDVVFPRCIPKSRQDLRTPPGGRRIRSFARSSALALLAQSPKGFLAFDRLDATALEVVVPTVERLADRRHLFQIAGERVFNHFVGGTPAAGRKILQLLSGFRGHLHFHAATVRPAGHCRQALRPPAEPPRSA